MIIFRCETNLNFLSSWLIISHSSSVGVVISGFKVQVVWFSMQFANGIPPSHQMCHGIPFIASIQATSTWSDIMSCILSCRGPDMVAMCAVKISRLTSD